MTTTGIVQHALDGLPEPHRTLWIRSRDAVRREVVHRHLLGDRLGGSLVIIVDPSSEVAAMLAQGMADHVVQHGGEGGEPLVVLLDPSRAGVFLGSLPVAIHEYIDQVGGDDRLIILSVLLDGRSGVGTVRLADTTKMH